MPRALKSVLIITKNFPPTNIVGAFRPFRLVKHLDKRGIRCQVITSFPKAGAALDADHLEELTERTTIYYLYRTISSNGKKDAQVLLPSSTTQKKNRFGSALARRFYGALYELNYRWMKPDPDIWHVPACVIKAMKLKAVQPPQVLVTTSPPHSIHVAGLILSRLWRVPWVVDFRDPWDDYIRTGALEVAHPINRWLKHRIIRRAEAVISTTQSYTENVINEGYTNDLQKFHTITNCFENNVAHASVVKDPEHFIISYVGIFYPQKDPYTFFRALRTWLDAMDSARRQSVMQLLRVQLIGSRDAATQQQVDALALNDVVRFVDRVPHHVAIRRLRQSDMALISTGLGIKTRPGWLPSKLFEYLGCRVPILAITPEGEAAEIIRQTNSGYVVTSEDHAAVGTLLDIEIQRKFGGTSVGASDFSFSGVDRFEEGRVMNQMEQILRSAAMAGATKLKNDTTPCEHLN